MNKQPNWQPIKNLSEEGLNLIKNNMGISVLNNADGQVDEKFNVVENRFEQVENKFKTTAGNSLFFKGEMKSDVFI